MQQVKTGVKNIEVRLEWVLDRQIIESVQDNKVLSPKYDVQLDKDSTSWCLKVGSVKEEDSEDFTQMSIYLTQLSGLVSETKKVKGTFSIKTNEGKKSSTLSLPEKTLQSFKNGWGFKEFVDLDDLSYLYVNDKITFICDLVFVIEKDQSIRNVIDDSASGKSKYDSTESETDFMKHMKSLYGLDSLSDLVIFCGDQKFLCHKLVLASRSDVFKDMLENENDKEKIKGELEITETEPATFKLLIDNIYTGKIPSNIDKVAKELYRLAIKYNLQILAKACEISLLGQITDANALDTLITMDKNKFATSATKDDVIKYITINAKEIIDTEEFKTFSKEQPELMIEIFRCFSDNQNKEVLSTMKTEGTV